MTPSLYLVDTSVLNRAHLPVVREVLQPLARRSLLATCSIVDLEVLYSAAARPSTSRHTIVDLIASVTGQPVRWVAPRGTLP